MPRQNGGGLPIVEGSTSTATNWNVESSAEKFPSLTHCGSGEQLTRYAPKFRSRSSRRFRRNPEELLAEQALRSPSWNLSSIRVSVPSGSQPPATPVRLPCPPAVLDDPLTREQNVSSVSVFRLRSAGDLYTSALSFATQISTPDLEAAPVLRPSSSTPSVVKLDDPTREPQPQSQAAEDPTHVGIYENDTESMIVQNSRTRDMGVGDDGGDVSDPPDMVAPEPPYERSGQGVFNSSQNVRGRTSSKFPRRVNIAYRVRLLPFIPRYCIIRFDRLQLSALFDR
nr:unnamed protein product [Spirometra erinaceieuropaei]